jgi:hypothetical protein
VVPCPGWLMIRSPPPDWVTKPWTMLRPNPVPLPTSLVVKKGREPSRDGKAHLQHADPGAGNAPGGDVEHQNESAVHAGGDGSDQHGWLQQGDCREGYQ